MRFRLPHPFVLLLGALENIHEEVIAPILILSRGLGFGAVTALA
jgi:hypothetical protein